MASVRDLGRLVRGDLPTNRRHGVNTAESAQVTVVDLHNLPDRAQRFVVGVILQAEFERKEKSGTAKPLLFVVLDELNKYAPREGTSPIKEVLLDIAERGRSLGRHPDRGPADRERGGAAHRRQLGGQGGRPARRGRGGPTRVRLPARRRSGSAR